MKKVVFIADAMGQALNCVAIGQQLKKLGHEVICVADKSFKGTFSKYGLQEHLINTHDSTDDAMAAEAWTQRISSSKKAFRQSTYEQIESYIIPMADAIVDSAINAQPHLAEALDQIQPDIICVDDVVAYPAILKNKAPWVRIISCNESEVPDPYIPPQLSGYSVNDKQKWTLFYDRLMEKFKPVQSKLNNFLKEHSLKEYPLGQLLQASPYINLFIFPESVKYNRQQPLDPKKFIYLNACVREELPYKLPAFKKNQKGPLIYLSYGSMGAFDHELINEQISSLGETEFRIIVNVGENKDKYQKLPDNVHIDSFFPQPKVIEQAALVIHHGGNNTFNECLYYGKPSIVFPFAWDGPDNAARVNDLNLGRSFDRYTYNNKELPTLIRALLDDDQLLTRLKKISVDMQANPGSKVAAQIISLW